MKIFIALLSLCCCSNLFSGYITTHDPNNPVVEQFTCITVPKSGTNLLNKLMMAIAKELGLEISNTTAPYTSHEIGGWYHITHTMGIPPHKWARKLKIVLIRDPRDVLVSTVYWIDHLLKQGKVSRWFQTRWPYMNFKKKVHTILYPIIPEQLMVNEYFNIVPFFKDTNNLVVRFEDLVGEQGGGSREAQIQTIHKVLDYLNIHLDQERISAIANELWGSSRSFRKGLIKNWIEYLDDPEINKWVDLKLGRFIQEFGY